MTESDGKLLLLLPDGELKLVASPAEAASHAGSQRAMLFSLRLIDALNSNKAAAHSSAIDAPPSPPVRKAGRPRRASC